MDNHITDGKVTIDIKEYRELVEAAAMSRHYKSEYYRLLYEGKGDG